MCKRISNFSSLMLPKLNQEAGVWKLSGCVGTELLNELRTYNIEDMTREELIAKIRSIINNSYVFMGYEKFANIVLKHMHVNHTNEKKREKIIHSRLQKDFANRMIVVDEAHNIRLIGDTNRVFKKVARTFISLVPYVQHMKLLFLTGTPCTTILVK